MSNGVTIIESKDGILKAIIAGTKVAAVKEGKLTQEQVDAVPDVLLEGLAGSVAVNILSCMHGYLTIKSPSCGFALNKIMHECGFDENAALARAKESDRINAERESSASSVRH
jgi:hypothetical protein